ncbi:hypothetical protein [Romboutsia sp. 13368]|uniref:hypothetical protein n=1 Tax=Romboutsia sp. 13368 TaxID=2708053 RepID=UPI0025CC4B8D|nr:hypothetical protein [Romboutsia sp. 13368]
MTCNYCKSTTIKYLLSDTNSTYTYCGDCNNDIYRAHKYIAIDSILKRILNNLKTLNEKNLKIEVKKENGFISLLINDIKVFETDFKYEFIKRDIYHLENIIHELVEDYYKFDLSKVDIIVC